MNENPTPLSSELFRRFTQAFGTQKLASMWKRENTNAEQTKQQMRAVRAEWEFQLRRFPPATLEQALQAVIESGRDWPPTLPEFVKVCKEFRRPEHAPAALMLPKPGESFTDAEKARENLERIRQMMSTAFKRV